MENDVSLALKRRMLIIMFCFVFGLLGMGARLGYVQVIEGKRLQELAD